jgi:hypothetical protein
VVTCLIFSQVSFHVLRWHAWLSLTGRTDRKRFFHWGRVSDGRGWFWEVRVPWRRQQEQPMDFVLFGFRCDFTGRRGFVKCGRYHRPG